jgi:hypothetical protein
MAMPIWDAANPLRRIRHAYVNWALLGVNILVFGIFQSGLVFDEAVGQALTSCSAPCPPRS